MLDIRSIRQEPDTLKAGLARRGVEGGDGMVDELLAQDLSRREGIAEVDVLKARRNEASRRIGEMKKAGETADDVIAEMRAVATAIGELDARVMACDRRIEELLLSIPNSPLAEVPCGGEENNEVVRTWGTRREFDFAPQAHWDLGEALDILDLPRGAKVSGSGFPLLKGVGARLQRVLIDFMIDLHVGEHGYRELRVPYLVTPEALMGTGQLPKFADESYQTERDDLWLIPTAEVPVTNLHRDEILEADELPVLYTAYSPCFRREAGAAGKDTRGLLRVHQFDKVELVRYERPDRSLEALEELTGEAERVLQILNLPYRVVRLATGDLGFSSAMTYDLEVWAPGVERWLEVSSCSTFTDYQSRRANIRFRPAAGEKPRFVHTLNGSGLALPRLMVAILETYQEADGTVTVPESVRDRLGTDRLA
jgi:seryl-tRNA synthetase